MPYISKFSFPDSGIFVETELGPQLFHHRTLLNLNDLHSQRLSEYGIRIKRGPFTAEEDARIYKNWKRLSDAYKLDYDSPTYYIGGRGVEGRGHTREIQHVPFWVYMCHGLAHRFAKQIRARMESLFDPNGWDPVMGRDLVKYSYNFTPDEDARLLRLYKELSGKWKEISGLMKRPQLTLIQRYTQLGRNSQPKELRARHWKRLWLSTMAAHSWPGADSIANVLQGELVPTEWGEVARRMRNKKRVVRKGWEELVCAVKQKMEECTSKTAEEALEEVVFSKAEKITNLQYGLYLNILRKSLPNECSTMHRRRKDMDMNEVEEKCVEAGITGFFTFGYASEGRWLYKRTLAFINQFEKLVWRKLKLEYNKIDVLRVMERACLRSLDANAVRTDVAVTELISYIWKNRDPQWTPPYRLKKYVIDEPIRAIFVKGDNSEWIGKKDRRMYTELVSWSDVSEVEDDWIKGADPGDKGNDSGEEEREKEYEERKWRKKNMEEKVEEELRGVEYEPDSKKKRKNEEIEDNIENEEEPPVKKQKKKKKKRHHSENEQTVEQE